MLKIVKIEYKDLNIKGDSCLLARYGSPLFY